MRWLSVYEALEAVYGAYSVLYLGLDHEATRNTDGAAKAKGIKSKIEKFKFLASLGLMKDVLASLTRLSKIFQSDNIDVDTMTTMLSVTRQQIDSFQNIDPPSVEHIKNTLNDPNNVDGSFSGVPIKGFTDSNRASFDNVKNKFIENLRDEFNKRFPEESLGVLQHLNMVLNPQKAPRDIVGLRNHAKESIEHVITFYGDSLDGEEVRQSFDQYKHTLVNHKHLSLKEFCLKLVCRESGFHNIFPGYCKLAEIMLTIPITSVPCERGFSHQNLIHTSARNKLTTTNVEQKMFIKTTLLSTDELCHKASAKFMSGKRSASTISKK